MMQLSVKVYGYQRRYFQYITCKKALLYCHEKTASYLSKKISVLGFFLVSQLFTATAEKANKKAQISYKSFPRLVKLFIQNYPGQTGTCNVLIYKINKIFRHFMAFLMSKCGRLNLHEMTEAATRGVLSKNVFLKIS